MRMAASLTKVIGREFVGSGGDTPALLHGQNQTPAISEITPDMTRTCQNRRE
jgi:hypothetical protein